MAQFDVCSIGNGYLVDCQSDLLSRMVSRFVIPLIPVRDLALVSTRLNPIFELPVGRLALTPQAARTVLKRDLRAPIASFGEYDTKITGAIDVLLGGV